MRTCVSILARYILVMCFDLRSSDSLEQYGKVEDATVIMDREDPGLMSPPYAFECGFEFHDPEA